MRVGYGWRRWVEWITSLALCGLLLAGAVEPAIGYAQPATPTPDVPAPEECTAAPRTLEELQGLIATPFPETTPVSPAATPGPVDAATEAAVHAVVRELIACSNAGDFWRVLALYSDRYVRDFVTQLVEAITGQPGPMTEAIYQRFAGNHPLPLESRLIILAFGPSERLPDGRIAVVVIGDDPVDREPAGPTRFILVAQGGQWRIDAFEDVPEEP